MDFSTLQSDVRSRLVEPTARYFTDVEVKRWINFGYKDFIRRTEWVNRVKAYGVTANQFEYSLPSDFLKAEEFVWQDKYKIFLADMDEMRDIMSAAPLTTSARPKAVLALPHDRRFRLYPTPSTTTTANQLNGAINSSVTTITVDSTTGFPSMGRLIIESEQVIYYGTTATTFTACVRGADDTTAASHSDDVAVTEGEVLMAYRYMPADLSASGDTPKIPEVYHEALVLYACAIGLKKRSLWREGNMMMNDYLAIVNQGRLERLREQLDRHWYVKDEEQYNGIYTYGNA